MVLKMDSSSTNYCLSSAIDHVSNKQQKNYIKKEREMEADRIKPVRKLCSMNKHALKILLKAYLKML